MKNSQSKVAGVSLVLLLLGGCATVPQDAGMSNVQQIVDDTHAVRLCNRADQRRRHQCLYDEMIARQTVCRGTFPQNVVGQQRTNAVAGEVYELAIAVANACAQSVGVGIGCQHQFAAGFSRPFDCRLKHLKAFGVRQMIGNVRKIAVGIALWLEDFNAGKSRLLQRAVGRCFADTMQRREYSRQTACRRKTQPADGIDVSSVQVCSKQLDFPIGHGLIEIERWDFLCGGDPIDDSFIVWRKNLSAVRPVGFETIVRRRIVRRRDHHADIALKMADRE